MTLPHRQVTDSMDKDKKANAFPRLQLSLIELLLDIHVLDSLWEPETKAKNLCVVHIL